jgi:HlyD family secretion protein
MKRLRKTWLAVAGLVLAIAVLAGFTLRGDAAPQYLTQRVERGDVRQVVEATGTIDAVNTVQVGSQVSGAIAKLNADFNSRVKAGQVVAEIDPSLFQGALTQAQADLANANANSAAARANLLKAQATAVQAQQQYQRTLSLANQGIVAKQQLDADKASADSAQAAVAAADAQVKQAVAQAQQKAAAVTIAKTNLDHTIIKSPIDGTVTARSVDVGQTVAASLQAPTLFSIAQDLTKMRVYAKTDESDVGQIRAGQQVTFKVDAFPNDTFHGVVEQVRMDATTVQNVVTYDTVIDFANPEMKLFPGMTAYVTIPVATATDALKVANSALHYQPDLKPEQVNALYAKYGIQAQKPASGAKGRAASQNASGDDTSSTAVLWKLGSDKNLVPVEVSTGITDHTSTVVAQVTAGSLTAGDEVITGTANATKKTQTASAPGLMSGAGGGGGRMGR